MHISMLFTKAKNLPISPRILTLYILPAPPLVAAIGVLSSLQNLEALVIPLQANKKTRPNDAFFTASQRTLAALASLLTSNHDASTSLDALSRLLPQVVSTVLPILARKPTKQPDTVSDSGADHPAVLALDAFLGSLVTTLLVPLVRVFATASTAFYTALLSTKKPPAGEVKDVRPLVSALLHTLLDDVLPDLVRSASGYVKSTLEVCVAQVVSVLTAECVRELEHLFTPSQNILPSGPRHPHSSSRNSDTNDTSVSCNGTLGETPITQKLARKDGVWYLCSALHLLLYLSTHTVIINDNATLGSSLRQHGTSGLPREDLSVMFRSAGDTSDAADCGETDGGGRCGEIGLGLGLLLGTSGRGRGRGLLGLCGHGGMDPGGGGADGMDEAEREMVLALVERTWLGS